MRIKKQLLSLALVIGMILYSGITFSSMAYENGLESTNIETLPDKGNNTTDPNDHILMQDNPIILLDKYNSSHEIYYLGCEDMNDEYGKLRFLYKNADMDQKVDYLNVQVYTEDNGKLVEGEQVYWNYHGVGTASFYIPFNKEFFNQPYIYFEIGVSDNLTCMLDNALYHDYKLIKIKNTLHTDIDKHWAEASIRDFINKGYIGGYPDGMFRPNNSITRAEFVTILNNVFGLTKSSGKVFSDTQSHWGKTSIDIAVTNGVCNGKSATEFKPNDPLTRQEAAVMISNYKKLLDGNHDKLNKYNDKEQVSSWAKDSVEGMIEKGYMGGYSDNTFRPKGKITRAEAVVTLSRVK